MDEKEVKKLEMSSPIVNVAIELGIKVRGSVGKCFRSDKHTDNESSFTLLFNPAKNTFSCRTCPDVGGTVIDLVSQCRGWSDQESIDWLAHRAQFDRMTQKLYHGKGRKK